MGTNHWIQCNDTPVKFARFPVTGLVEGRSYIFRVRAVNKSGMSRPSRVSEPVAAMDPADRARMRGTTAYNVISVIHSSFLLSIVLLNLIESFIHVSNKILVKILMRSMFCFKIDQLK